MLSAQAILFISIFAAAFAKTLDKQELTRPRYGKFLGIFGVGVVRFKNDVCNAADGLSGTCYTKRQCSDMDGIPSGGCASNIGVCCVVQQSCGGVSAYNNTYFINNAHSKPTTSGGKCVYTIQRCSSDFCSVRIDFLTSILAQPDANGHCAADVMKIVGSAYTIPDLCGDNTGQHIYADFYGDEDIKIAIYTSSDVTTARTWRIKVQQIGCDCPERGPKGCLQYYTGLEGTVKSFNYGKTGSSAVLGNGNGGNGNGGNGNGGNGNGGNGNQGNGNQGDGNQGNGNGNQGNGNQGNGNQGNGNQGNGNQGNGNQGNGNQGNGNGNQGNGNQGNGNQGNGNGNQGIDNPENGNQGNGNQGNGNENPGNGNQGNGNQGNGNQGNGQGNGQRTGQRTGRQENGRQGTRHLANLNYGICVRQEEGYCGIQWKRALSAKTSFTLSGSTTDAIADGSIGTAGASVTGANCPNDYIVIPNPIVAEEPMLASDRFCGNGLPDVVTYSRPFVVTVVTNDDEEGDAGNIGFALTYTQLRCTGHILCG